MLLGLVVPYAGMDAGLTLMTWNLLHGGGPRRLPPIALALLDLAPDIVLLSEYRQARGGQLAGVLSDHGWAHQLTATARGEPNGMLLASREPVEITPDLPVPPAGLEARWIECEVPSWGLALAGVHIPHRGSGTRRTALWKHAVERARSHKAGSFVLLGDFNTGRNEIDGPKGAFDCTQRLGELAAMRYTDAWRSAHPNGAEGTWAGADQIEHRIDHAHLSESLQTRLVRVWHERSLMDQKLSDHAALMVTIGRC